MKTNIKRIKNNFFMPVLSILLAGLVFTSCTDMMAGPNDSQILSESLDQSFDKKQEITGNALDEKGKIYVCKYVSTPDVSERIKKGNAGLVHVSPNTQRNNLPNFPEVNVGDSWTDRHSNSTVIDPVLGAEILANKKALSEELAEDLAAACAGENGGGVIGGGAS